MFLIEISQASSGTGVDSDLGGSLTTAESTHTVAQSPVQKPKESTPPSTKTCAQPLGVVTDVQPKLETDQSSEHPVSHLTETTEEKDDTKSSMLISTKHVRCTNLTSSCKIAN